MFANIWSHNNEQHVCGLIFTSQQNSNTAKADEGLPVKHNRYMHPKLIEEFRKNQKLIGITVLPFYLSDLLMVVTKLAFH